MTSEINYLETKYSFQSVIGENDASRYISEYSIEIYGHCFDEDIEEMEPVLIGKAKVLLLLLGLADNNHYSYRYIFDNSMTMSELGGVIYDWEKDELKKKFEDWFIDSYNSNILFIDRIEILPPYRSHGLGKKIIKDVLCRFSGCFGVMILKALPLQHENKSAPINNDWDVQMEYNKMEQDEKMATKKLNTFYKSLGFTQLFKDDYFFYNSALKNSKLDKININE